MSEQESKKPTEVVTKEEIVESKKESEQESFSDNDSDSELDLHQLRRKETDETEGDTSPVENDVSDHLQQIVAEEPKAEPSTDENKKPKETSTGSNQKKSNRNRPNRKNKHGGKSMRGGSANGGGRGGYKNRSYRKDGSKRNPRDSNRGGNNDKPFNQKSSRRGRGGRRQFDSRQKSYQKHEIKPLDPDSPPFIPDSFAYPIEMFQNLNISGGSGQQ